MGDTNRALAHLQTQWKEMFQKRLPEAATSKSSSQLKWPVHVDHCFARIILDKVVGIDAPWMQKLKSPAYKNMSETQLRSAIKLGEKIMAGQCDLVELNDESLDIRGKSKGLKKGENCSGKTDTPIKKRKSESDEVAVGKRRKTGPKVSQFFASAQAKEDEDKTNSKIEESFTDSDKSDIQDPWVKDTMDLQSTVPTESKSELADELLQIAASNKTPFQKNVLTLLCQVPRGQYTTYGAISKHLSSSPRAVGNALKNNPFAPMVPCHRVLASGGFIGGFEGSWGRKGEEGKNDTKKRKLLRDEGIRFDGKGKVVGRPWESFTS
ncbi:hypothetical protein PVAG01_07854 [Phlyctema vagabunda]|uniref:Methylated-DNA--protein-cysteine methyltransferase n=1 Tax=Phlyctema vagabunda TaxID=108571 RepID=A0ABR4PDQ6_9HELO